MNRTRPDLEVNDKEGEEDQEDDADGDRARSSEKKALGKPLTKPYRASQALPA